jgi:hypothetical protein
MMAASVTQHALAADVEVSASAARTGDSGLMVICGSACGGDPDPVLEDHEVVAEERFEGCGSLTAANGFVVSSTGRAILASGGAVILGNGFAVQSGGEMVAGLDISLSNFAWIEDPSPPAVARYSFELHADFDGLVVACELEHFAAISNGGEAQLKVLLRPGPALVLAVRQNDGSYHETAAAPVAPGWNEIIVNWHASSTASATLQVNGSPRLPVSEVDNCDARIDRVRWGAVGGDAGSSGIILMDDFRSWWCDPELGAASCGAKHIR